MNVCTFIFFYFAIKQVIESQWEAGIFMELAKNLLQSASSSEAVQAILHHPTL